MHLVTPDPRTRRNHLPANVFSITPMKEESSTCDCEILSREIGRRSRSTQRLLQSGISLVRRSFSEGGSQQCASSLPAHREVRKAAEGETISLHPEGRSLAGPWPERAHLYFLLLGKTTAGSKYVGPNELCELLAVTAKQG
jgi:hypothetical protein